jgi:uncharacterized protein (DUF2141 family)
MLNKQRNIITLMVIIANFFCAAYLYSQEINAFLRISGVTVGGGSVYAAVFSSDENYNNDRRFVEFILDAAGTTLSQELALPAGEYVVSVYQDTNNNGSLDTGVFGIPREPFGFTNYSSGIPGNFQRLKVPVNASQTTITVNIGRYRWW